MSLNNQSVKERRKESLLFRMRSNNKAVMGSGMRAFHCMMGIHVHVADGILNQRLGFRENNCCTKDALVKRKKNLISTACRQLASASN
jgi:hypothetical protein